MNKQDIIKDDLRTSNYLGSVVDVNDPRKEGRVKVRIFGKFDDLEVEDIPWAEPKNTITGGSETGSGFFSLPKIGSIVEVSFDNGNIYQPLYICNTKISNELKAAISENDDDYSNTHSILYDTETNPGPVKIWYVPSKGLMLEVGESIINIKDDLSIIITANDGKTLHIQKEKISIGKEDESDEPAVLGNKNEDVLNDIVKKLDEILTMIITFATTENAAASAAFILAPLAPGLVTLLQDATSKKANLTTLNTKIPKTKSKTISLDK